MEAVVIHSESPSRLETYFLLGHHDGMRESSAGGEVRYVPDGKIKMVEDTTS
jgi:hypothetical protein